MTESTGFAQSHGLGVFSRVLLKVMVVEWGHKLQRSKKCSGRLKGPLLSYMGKKQASPNKRHARKKLERILLQVSGVRSRRFVRFMFQCSMSRFFVTRYEMRDESIPNFKFES